MSDVRYLLGQEDLRSDPMRAWSDEACAFLMDLSSALMQEGRAWPDVAAFAFWCRKSNLQRLKSVRSDLEFLLGRGLAFHIAPSNIPVNFAFSFAFSLLAGNANLVRVPSRPFPQTEVICRAISTVLEDFPKIARRTAFVTYPVNQEVTADFSMRADVRMIWGGDRTIAAVRGLPTRPRCLDLCFADRYSLAMLDAGAVRAAEDSELKRLAELFYRDTYLVDQNACSSPQLVLWRHDDPEGRERFWNEVHAMARQKYALQPAVAISKYTQVFQDLLDTDLVQQITRPDNYLCRAELRTLTSECERLRGFGGYFFEYALQDLRELEGVVSARYQTLTTYGLDRAELRRFVVENHLPGIDRIVPIGSALDIGPYWDGCDLVGMMSRRVELV